MAKEKKQLRKLTDEELKNVNGGVLNGIPEPCKSVPTESLASCIRNYYA